MSEFNFVWKILLIADFTYLCRVKRGTKSLTDNFVEGLSKRI